MKNKKRNMKEISDAELEVMKIVWENGGPTTFKQIRTILNEEKGWDSSTVRTLISRLVEKEALLQEKREVYYYTASFSEEEFMKERTRLFLNKVYGGNAKGLVSAMLSHDFISEDEIEDVREFWKKGRKQK